MIVFPRLLALITGVAAVSVLLIAATDVDRVQRGRSVRLVATVQNEKAVNISDASLKRRVQSALLADPSLKTSEIIVESVSNGVVVLGGTARSDRASKQTFHLVAAVPGVRGVTGWIDDYRWPEMLRVIENSDRLVLLSLDPARRYPWTEGHLEMFHDFAVLGKAEIHNPEDRVRLIHALRDATDAARIAGPAHCFNPRHGISARLGDDTVDLVICFECHEIKAYGKNGMLDHGLATSPLETFNIEVEIAGLPLPSQGH